MIYLFLIFLTTRWRDDEFRKKFQDLQEIKNKIISQIDKLKEPNRLEIKFIKLLLFTYQHEEKLNNLNYNIIQNKKNIEKAFKSNKIELFEKIYKEGINYISILNKISNKENIKANSLKIILKH